MKLFFSVGLVIALSTCSPAKVPAPAKTASPPPPIYLHEPARVGDIEFTVTEASGFTKYRPQLPGGVAIILTTKMRNVGSKPIPAKDMPIVHLVDANGVIYNGDLTLTSSYQLEKPVTRKGVSDLNPGLSETDSVVFELSEERFTGSAWRITPDGKVLISMCEREKAQPDGTCRPWHRVDEKASK